jgi:hypothetical protein
MDMIWDSWVYERVRRHGTNGTRWHFVAHNVADPAIPYDEQPYELYFRDDERTEFGLLRFPRRKDNPYRNYEAMVDKIMNNESFRASLLHPATRTVWRKNWK